MSILAKLPPKTLASLAARADRIRVALARRDEQDQFIARELRAAKDELGGVARWLEWTHKEFGWGRSVSFARLDPKQMAAQRVAQNARDARKRSPKSSDTPPPASPKFSMQTDREKHASLVVEMIREGYKALAKKHHPDAGGSGETMALLSAARDWGVDFIKNPPLINLGV